MAFKYPNIKALTGYLVNEIAALSDSSASESGIKDESAINKMSQESEVISQKEVEQLSEDEAEMSLLDELEKLESRR